MTIIVAITGASGVQYGVRLLEALDRLGVGTQLVVTKSGQQLIDIETDYSLNYVTSLVNRTYDEMDLAAPIASGSHISNGMVIIPCEHEDAWKYRTRRFFQPCYARGRCMFEGT